MSSLLPANLAAFGVSLARLREQDIELVRQWRNHPEVARHMISQEHISAAQQLAWFRRIDAAADRACYLVRYDGEPTAFASVTGTDGAALAPGDTLEAAIYLAPDSRCRGTMLAFAPALALNDACFDRLGCAALAARVRVDNAPALRFNAQMGYRETGRDDRLVHMTLVADDYRAATARLRDMLSRASARHRKTTL
jgi:RimJ/RimL family protein N-acetyltransferase